MTVDWPTLVKRRKINVSEWLKNSNVSDYEGFIDLLKAIGVDPIPRESDVSHLFSKKISSEEKKMEILDEMKEDVKIYKTGKKKYDKKFSR